MHFLMKIILALYVILYSMDQASPIKCYDCEGNQGDSECDENPKQKKFEVTCPDNFGDEPKATRSAENTIDLILMKHAKSTRNTPGLKNNECWKATGTNLTNQEKVISRSCGSKQLSDETLKIMALGFGISVESVHRCDTDLCNSSDVLGAKSLCSISSLVLTYLINFKLTS